MLTSETRAPEARERPIIFSAPMVRAILAGRKTQTRRIAKRPTDHFHASYTHLHQGGEGFVWSDGRGGCQRAARLPARVGDRLWVRETWQVARETTDYETGGEYDVYEWDEELFRDPREHLNGSPRYGVSAGLFYRADGEDVNPSVFYPLIGVNRQELRPAEITWRSPLFMPRWASRLTLEVTEVRVERLQDISHEDAAAEGLIAVRTPAAGILRNVATDKCLPITRTQWQGAPDLPLRGMERAAYRDLWNSIHGKDAWDANPWVAAITFRPTPTPGGLADRTRAAADTKRLDASAILGAQE